MLDQPDTPEHCQSLGDDKAQATDATPSSQQPAEVVRAEPVEVLPRSPSPAPVPEDAALSPFGAALAPVLLNLCESKLADLNWFRTDWQRGGALTGYATWTDEQGSHEAVVKFPIPPKERRWLVQLSSDDVTPRVFAHGSELGGYDLAWVVMERLPHGPIGTPWGAQAYDLIAEAAANFYARARLIPMGDPPPPNDWAELMKRSKQSISKDTIQHSQRWGKVLKAARKKLPDWLDTWNARDTGYWCHGDLHPGNAMSRHAAPASGQQAPGPAVLFDLACVRQGHWVEDAVYLEHLYWASPASLHGSKPVKLIAQHLRDYGLPPGHNWPDLANIYRALLAMTAPAQRHNNIGSAHTAAALNVLERLV
ncbi:MAG: aminoglycoside phosphotransferase family protein [Phycisphaeraceae bacterium]